ncbi:dentin sialophosphoprotein-like isoform X1 [Salvia splendens]|uniref:dentin sialophosphoprotein-like isoform X1 n=1 Tax=Salvia splendens TaxID=180675 RepID=UPI001C26176D|nr:dentin sialophosphoprotein-like isoform X1 [Salvia splendens]
MDFHSMNRKQLQTLCKKHKIPAHLSNLEMANRLTKFLQDENVSEIESVGEGVNKKSKKVRFSPEHELIEFTRSPIQIKRRSRRNSVSGRDSNWSIEMEAETVGREGSAIQTGELKLVEAEVKQNKRGRKAVKCNDGQKIASAVDSCEDGQLEMEVRPVRMTRLRGKTEAEGEMKYAKDDYKRDKKASDSVKNAGNTEIAENHSRVTRSKAQKVTEAPAAKEKRGRKEVKNIGKVAAVRAETGDNRDSLSKRGDEGEGKSAMGSDERTAGEHVTVEPQLVLRRSKRKVNGVGESEMLVCDTREHENPKVEGSTKTLKLLASGVPEVDTEISGVEGDQGRGAVQKIEEHIQKMEPRRSNRRKTVIDSTGLIGDRLRSSLTPSDIVPEVSKDEKMVIQPIGVTRRSRRKIISVKLVSTIDNDSAVENLNAEKPKSESCLGEKEIFAVVQKNTRVTRNTSKCNPPGSLDKVGTNSAAENIVAEKHISESCLGEKENVAAVQKNMRLTRNTSKCKPPGPLDMIGGDSNIHQKNKVTRRKRGHVTGDAMIKNNDTISGEQSLKGRSSEEVVSPTAKGKFSDEMNQPHRLDKPQTLDTSESANNSCSKNIISDVDLTSIKETHEMKEEVSAADSADNSCMNLANEGKLVNSNANAASTSKSAARGTESSASEDQICNSSIVEVKEGKLLLEFDVQESVEQNIKEVDRNGSEARMYSQAEDSGCNNKINDQVLAEGLNVLEEEGSAETCSSADSDLYGDQTDVKTDLEVAKTEVDEHLQPCVSLVVHHNDQDDLELGASSNILDINNEDTSRTPGAFESCGTDYTQSKSSSKLKEPSLGMTMHHVDDGVKGFETCFHNGRASELAEADEGGCSKDQSNSSDQFNESNMPELCHSERNAGIVSPDGGHDDFQVDKLFNQEGRYGITPQEKETFSGEHSVEDFNEQGLSQHDSPSIAPTTMHNSTGDHKSSNSQETDPSSPSCVSETQAKKQKSLVANSNELAHSNKRQVTLSSASELAVNAVCFLKSSEMKDAGGLIADEDVNDENYGIDEEVLAEASISHVKSCSVNKIVAGNLGGVKFQDTVETEHEHRNLVARKTESDADEEATLATSRKIWTEAELQNLFGTSDEYAPPGLSDTFCQGSERANMTMSENKSTPSNNGILTEKQEKEMDEESGIESDANIYENVLESLFVTPVKIATPCKTEETYSHDSILDGSVTSVQEGSVTMKENVPTGVMSNEKAQNAGYEIENNLGTGAALPGHGGDDIREDVNEFESFDRVLDGSATSVQEWSEAMKENVATEVTSNEKANTAGYEIGGNSCTGAALSDNGGDDICEDVNEVERVLDGSVTSIQECSEAMKENVATGVTSNERHIMQVMWLRAT